MFFDSPLVGEIRPGDTLQSVNGIQVSGANYLIHVAAADNGTPRETCICKRQAADARGLAAEAAERRHTKGHARRIISNRRSRNARPIPRSLRLLGRAQSGAAAVCFPCSSTLWTETLCGWTVRQNHLVPAPGVRRRRRRRRTTSRAPRARVALRHTPSSPPRAPGRGSQGCAICHSQRCRRRLATPASVARCSPASPKCVKIIYYGISSNNPFLISPFFPISPPVPRTA